MIFSIMLHLQSNQKLSFLVNHVKDYLPSKNYESFSITHTTKAVIDSIISSLNSSKPVGPNSKPLKILK